MTWFLTGRFLDMIFDFDMWVLLIVGIFASLAALMFNCVRKEDIDYSPYDEGEWRYE